MADRTDRSRITVPTGFRELLGALCREILRHQPKNIIEFAAQYFEQKLRERDGESRPLLQQASSKDMIRQAVETGEISPEVEEKAAVTIQTAYRGHAAREQVKQMTESAASDLSSDIPSENEPGENKELHIVSSSPFAIVDDHVDLSGVLKMQPAPTPYFDEEGPPLPAPREARLVLLPSAHHEARVVPLLDAAHLAQSVEVALTAAKVREWTSTVYLQSPRGAVSLRPSKGNSPMSGPPGPPPPADGEGVAHLPALFLLRADGRVTPLRLLKLEEGVAIVEEAPAEYIVAPVSGPDATTADADATAEAPITSRLISHGVPSAATLSEYISMRLKGHLGPTGSFHRRSVAALRSRTLAVHPSMSAKTEASLSSESSFIAHDSQSFALPPPPPNTPVPSLGQLDSTAALVMSVDSDAEFTSAASLASFMVPPPPPNTPASSGRSGSNTSEAVEQQRPVAMMSGYLSDSHLGEMSSNVGRDTLSAPDVTMAKPNPRVASPPSSTRSDM